MDKDMCEVANGRLKVENVALDQLSTDANDELIPGLLARPLPPILQPLTRLSLTGAMPP